MATDWRDRLRRLALPAGLAWLALLGVFVARAGRALAYELGRLGSIGLPTIADRTSQLRPWPWKAPLMLVALALLVALAAGCVVAAWVAAARRALDRDREI
jgi:hypothetical protein